MWPWEPGLENSWQCSVAIYSFIVKLSDQAQPVTKVSKLKRIQFTVIIFFEKLPSTSGVGSLEKDF